LKESLRAAQKVLDSGIRFSESRLRTAGLHSKLSANK